MNTCKKCGFPIKDGVLFCKKCGTPILKEERGTSNEKQVEENLMQLSLDMRKISDRMISAYVKAVKTMEFELEEAKAYAQTTVIELKGKVNEYEGEIKRYKAYVSELEEKVKKLEEGNNRLVSEMLVLQEIKPKEELGQHIQNEKPTNCPNCNALITDDMAFCGNCGTKL